MELSPLLFFLVFLASLLGAMGLGGGSLLLLALSLASPLPQRQAAALNLLLFLPTAGLALLFHRKNKLLRWGELRRLLPGGILGALLGSALALGLDSALLKKAFALFLLVSSGRELFALWRERGPHKVPPPWSN